MNSFSPKELETLIKLEAEGKLTAEDLYKRCALKTIQNQDNYVGSAIAHIIVGAICVGIGGTMVAPVFVALWVYSWFKSFKSRSAAIRRVNAGEFIDFLEPEDRVSYEQDMKATQTVEVPAQPQAQAPTTTSATPLTGLPQETIDRTVSDASSEVMVPNIALDMGRYPRQALIIGTPGSGKGILHSNATRYMAQYNPRFTRIGVDPKNDPKETGYWEGYHHLYRKRIDTMTPEQVAVWVSGVLDHYAKLPAPKLLVWDELALTVSMLEQCKEKVVYNRFKTVFVAIVSNGDSREEILWAISQNAHCENIGFNGGMRGNFRAIGLVAYHNIAAASALTSTNFIAKISDSSLQMLVNASPSKRAVFDGKTNQWYPMVALDNFLAINRDERKEIPQASPRQKQTEALERMLPKLEYETIPTGEDDR